MEEKTNEDFDWMMEEIQNQSTYIMELEDDIATLRKQRDELEKHVAALQAENATLKGQNTKLKAKVEKLETGKQ